MAGRFDMNNAEKFDESFQNLTDGRGNSAILQRREAPSIRDGRTQARAMRPDRKTSIVKNLELKLIRTPNPNSGVAMIL
jgi:hypothetical protein